MPEIQHALTLLYNGSVVAAECDAFVENELTNWRSILDPLISAKLASGGAIPAREYLRRQQCLRDLMQTAQSHFRDVDVIVSPTVPISPPTLTEVSDPENYRYNNAASLRNTYVGNALGLCALSMPVGLDELGLPVGLQLLAKPQNEESLLAVARAIENTLGNSQQRLGQPPLCPQS